MGQNSLERPVEEWLGEIEDATIRKKALKARRNCSAKDVKTVNSKKKAISEGFHWSQTIEGFNYWHEFHNSIDNLKQTIDNKDNKDNKQNKLTKTEENGRKKGQIIKVKSLYLQSSEELEKQAILDELEDAESQLTEDTRKTERALRDAKRDLKDVVRARPFNSNNIIDAKNEIKALEDGLKELKELKKLF